MKVDIAKAIGQEVLLSIIGHNVTFSFKKKSQAITIGMKSSIKIDSELLKSVSFLGQI